MNDIIFSRSLYFFFETPGFIDGPIDGIEFFNNLELTTFYREIINIK